MTDEKDEKFVPLTREILHEHANKKDKGHSWYYYGSKEIQGIISTALDYLDRAETAEAKNSRYTEVFASLLGKFASAGVCEPLKGFLKEPHRVISCVEDLVCDYMLEKRKHDMAEARAAELEASNSRLENEKDRRTYWQVPPPRSYSTSSFMLGWWPQMPYSSTTSSRFLHRWLRLPHLAISGQFQHPSCSW